MIRCYDESAECNKLKRGRAMNKVKIWELEKSLLKRVFRNFTKEEQRIILRYNKEIGEAIRKEEEKTMNKC